MNKKDLERYCLEHAGEPLPPDANECLDRDPALRQRIDQLIALQKLIRLKNHEQPDPGAVSRCQVGVSNRIQKRQHASIWFRLREWFELHEQAPAPAYAAVALAAIIASSAIFYSVGRGGAAAAITEKSNIEMIPVVVADRSIQTNETTLQMVADHPPARKPIVILRVDQTLESNAGGSVTFGGAQSVPVSYER